MSSRGAFGPFLCLGALALAISSLAGCKGDKAGLTFVPEDRGASDETVSKVAPTAVETGAVDLEAYRAALQEGRKLADKKEWPEAIAAFERALAARPGDARASSELGWVAFLADDLDRAKSANETALAKAKTPQIKAASLYNLGRVAEARKQDVVAAGHYRGSLQLREHAAVRDRLLRLDARQCEGLELLPWTDAASGLTDVKSICRQAKSEDPDVGDCDATEMASRVVMVTTEVIAQRFDEVFVVRGDKLLPLPFGTYSSGRGYSESIETITERDVGPKRVLLIAVLVSDDDRDAKPPEPWEETRMSACVVDGTRTRCLQNDRHGGAVLEVTSSGAVRFASAPGTDADPCLKRTFALW